MLTKIKNAQDEEASVCQFCNRSDIRAPGTKHHCRACGKVRKINCYMMILFYSDMFFQYVCGLCSLKKANFKDTMEQARVCDSCYKQCKLSGIPNI